MSAEIAPPIFGSRPNMALSPEAGPGDVADVEDEPAEEDEHRQQVAGPGHRGVGGLRGALARSGR